MLEPKESTTKAAISIEKSNKYPCINYKHIIPELIKVCCNEAFIYTKYHLYFNKQFNAIGDKFDCTSYVNNFSC